MTIKEFFDMKMFSLLLSLVLLVIVMFVLGSPHSLDARFYYNHLEALDFLSNLSWAQNKSYRMVLYVDLFLIYKYTRALTLGASRVFPQNTKAVLCFLAPGLLDVIETSNILWVLHSGDLQKLFPYLGVVTCLKWISGAAVTAVLFYRLFKNSKKV